MSETMGTAITSAFNSIKGDVLDVMEKALPIGLTIMGIGLAVSLGVAFFKKISKKA